MQLRQKVNTFQCKSFHISYSDGFLSDVEQTGEHLRLFCPKCAAERQRYFGDSIDVTDVFQDSDNLVEFLISLGHVPFRIGTA